MRLLDNSNFQKYRRGQSHRAYGGQARRSPVHLTVPRTGTWNVVIDFGGLPGNVRASVNVLPGAVPAIRQQAPPALATIAENVADLHAESDGESQFDVFVSHATEDKEQIVRPLAHALVDRGLTVWYDEFELRIGDSLRRKIDAGLARSAFGLVILSPSFFNKNWTQYELDGLVTREMTGEQIILPVWHEITHEEIVGRSPSLADKVALRTSDHSIEEIADQVAAVIE